MEKNHFGANISVELESPRIFRPRFLVESVWDVEHWRGDNMLSKTRDHNICTDEGLNHLLDVYFHGTAASGTWYILIFESDTTPAAGTTYAVPVFTESTAYAEANRVEYNEAAAAAKVTTNTANKATFTMNDTKTIYGAALVDDNTKDDQVAAGAVMYCAAKFASSKSVVAADVLKVTIAITAADA